MKKLMPLEKQLIDGEIANAKMIQFFEQFIIDKSLLVKKHKKKKQQTDILAKNPVYEWYRQALYITVFSYKMFAESATQYWSYFKKDNNEKKSQ